MKLKISIIVCLIVGLVTAGCGPRTAIKRDYDFSKIKRIAIADFIDNLSYLYQAEAVAGNAVADEFVLQLMMMNFDVVERFRLQSVMKEQDLGASGRIDPATAKKIGKLVGADVILTGTVTQYTPHRRDIMYVDDGYGGKRQEMYLVDAEIGLSVRMFDVETGVIIWAGFYRYNSFYIESAIAGVVSGLLNSLEKVLPKTARY